MTSRRCCCRRRRRWSTRSRGVGDGCAGVTGAVTVIVMGVAAPMPSDGIAQLTGPVPEQLHPAPAAEPNGTGGKGIGDGDRVGLRRAGVGDVEGVGQRRPRAHGLGRGG